MPRAPIGKHGRDHRPGGHDPIPGLSSGGSIYPSAVQPVPLDALFYGRQQDWNPGTGWGQIADALSFSGGVFTNAVSGPTGPGRTPASGDYITGFVTLGPKGSAWSVFTNHKLQTGGGKFKITIASVPESAGELDDSSLTFIDPLGFYTEDTYQGVDSYDGGSSEFAQSLVLGGDDGVQATTVTGTDPDTGYPIINGGAGTYRWKLAVTGKNASSSGYRVDLIAMAWARANKFNLI